MRNSVLARIEVKSNLTKQHLKDFKDSCDQFCNLKLDLDNERYQANKIKLPEINMLFAYKSKVQKDSVFKWFKDINDGSISAVCVLNRGFWKLNMDRSWDRYDCQSDNPNIEHLGAFVGLISNTAFNQHICAQGRDRLSSLESGIGHYFNNWVKTGR